MQILSIAIQKGGCGKTTTAAALANAAAFRGKKVLAIDADPQGQLSFTLAADTRKAGSYELLQGAPAGRLVQRIRPGLDVIPASWNLSTITSGKGSARRLQKALEPLKGEYDLIIIDTPPTAGELQYNALQGATGLIIPVTANIYDLQGLYQIADTAQRIQKTNKALSFTGIIITQFDGRSGLARQMQETIIQKAAGMGIPYLGTVRAGVAIREAAALQESIFEYAPRSKPAADYMAIYEKIMKGE